MRRKKSSGFFLILVIGRFWGWISLVAMNNHKHGVDEIERTYILRPSIITGNRQEKRAGERIGVVAFKILNPLLIGRLRKYRAVKAEAIARKMIELANSNEPSKIVESDQI